MFFELSPILMICAVILDLILGDPRALPHPVTGIFKFGRSLESVCRRLPIPLVLAGAITWVLTVAMAVFLVWFSICMAINLHPLLGQVVVVYWLFSGLAIRSLALHALVVDKHLRAGEVLKARTAVGFMVGRDTESLHEAGIVRACVESLGEGFVDGVLAPVFFAVLGGPVGLWFYKAVNTMDSMFGYRNERYHRFGWVAAKMDDLLNWVPARLSVFFLLPAAYLCGQRANQGWRMFWRDRLKHPSPNSAHGEAFLAGCLGIQLGGSNSYQGIVSKKPLLGEAVKEPEAAHIKAAVWVMVLAALLAVFLAVVVL